MQKQYGNRGLVVIGVSVDEHGPAEVKRFVAQSGVNYRVVLGHLSLVTDFWRNCNSNHGHH
jgi:hypothetical protein